MLSAGVIGVGNMGKNHARVYSELENAKLVAVSDIDINLAKSVAEKFGCKCYKNYNEMLEKENLDIVSVVVPTKLHEKVAIDAISNGINTLVEKPISDNIRSAKKIIHAAKKHGVKLAVGHIERFNPAITELKKIIESGDIGKIFSISAKRVGYFPINKVSTNIIIEVGIHDIDIFNYLLKKLPSKIYAHCGKTNLKTSQEDYANILFDYDGVSAMLEINWVTPIKIRRLEVTGSDAFTVLDYITQDLNIFRNNFSSKLIGKKIIEKIAIQKQEPLKLELKHFLECVINDSTPLNDGESSYNALKVADEALAFLNKNKVGT
jgi:UDP-N-acetylglucosamine 3-dehydrogenase